MKKILVLTDYTDNSDHAAAAAVPLCAKLNANILLFNTFISQPVLSEFGGTPYAVEQMIWVDESKGKITYLKENLEKLATEIPRGAHRPSISSQREEGSLEYQLKFLLERRDIELIIMGARSGTTMEHLLIGSDTSTVIDQTNRPVLIIPESTDLKKIKKVTIACDFDEGDLHAVHYLTKLGRLLNFHLEILHVSLWGHDDAREIEMRNKFSNRVKRYRYPDISYQNISGKELPARLNRHCEENGSDLLVLVHDQHSFLNRIFKGSHTRDQLKHQQIPVMMIPAGMEDR
ncbi:Nucleotide-binding universal stress protein, UspA family [Mucilaginibacter sp. OK268]|uniref:universal stress protein n=1 Tax=Mucilaginibacter sp. OK268 TaxID=1881048 RepID=UPI0008835EC2|nr:universal stress protein [Mucilaginibacter sp. OK268]SDP96910.1 Nucleotide-binding universal stress protein, UspA family [Mucilaginibacter sp. OK268]